MTLNGGPLAYASTRPPAPLTTEEEAALAFAACGITGPVFADLPYASGSLVDASGGNIMKQFTGRTVASGDALHAVTVFVTNDEGSWMLRRPQDFPRAEIPALVEAAREHRWLGLYERSRVRIADGRTDVPRELPFIPSFNKWSANVPGTTYFIPVNELTALYINILLSAFSSDFRYFVVDERRGFKPAGVSKFARSRGGTLHDDPRDGRTVTIGFLEAWLFEMAAIEQGSILQNLGLMTQALGIGGFPHFAAHPFAWPSALGFPNGKAAVLRVMGTGVLTTAALRALGRDVPLPARVGLERNGEVLIKPYCPPWYPSMTAAVRAFVDEKYASGSGSFSDGGAATAWKEPARVQQGIPEYSAEAIDATIAYCEYVFGRYGRFPAACGPFRSVLAYQAHRLDPDFHEKFYKPA
jgi:hypothetical protein